MIRRLIRYLGRRRRVLENGCGNPACPGSNAHAPDPGDRVMHPPVPFTPARRDEILSRSYGGSH